MNLLTLLRYPTPRLRSCWLAVCLLVLAFSGCTGWRAHNDAFPDNDLSQTLRKARPANQAIEYGGLSERGRQIERDLPPM
jgi:hypothetical protein